MKPMKARNKLILGIISVSVVLATLISLASGYIALSGFTLLEQDLAVDNANRVFKVALSNLNHLYLQNLDNAYWDETYAYAQNPNPKFIKDNFLEDFFNDNHYNFVIILDKTGKVLWSAGYDLDKKKYIPIDANILDYFKRNAFDMASNPGKYYKIVNRDYGISGFLKLPSNTDLGYFALNFITDSNDTKPPIGTMVFGKILSAKYYADLSKDLDYPINLISMADFSKDLHGQTILKSLSTPTAVYTEPLNEDTLISYKIIKDFSNNPIAVLRVDLPRNIYNQIKHSSLKNQLILLGFSLLVIIAMSTLVYLFFRKQEAITLSFERFVPHQLIELLNKKDILEIGIGNHSQRIITVLFMDIRNFTTISEGLNAQDNFDFINTMLKEIAPVVSANNGFIDKYIGDAIMALFPNENSHADDAVKAATMILQEIEELNKRGTLKTTLPVRVGIGINTGESMLGIIGAEGRLEGTVISDMVNTASRIQTLTKTYERFILISEACYQAMQHPEIYTITHVDDVLVKGKSVKVSVYAVG